MSAELKLVAAAPSRKRAHSAVGEEAVAGRKRRTNNPDTPLTVTTHPYILGSGRVEKLKLSIPDALQFVKNKWAEPRHITGFVDWRTKEGQYLRWYDDNGRGVTVVIKGRLVRDMKAFNELFKAWERADWKRWQAEKLNNSK